MAKADRPSSGQLTLWGDEEAETGELAKRVQAAADECEDLKRALDYFGSVTPSIRTRLVAMLEEVEGWQRTDKEVGK